MLCDQQNVLESMMVEKSMKKHIISYGNHCTHCSIGGNGIADHLVKKTLHYKIDPLVKIHYSDLKPFINIYI